MILADIHTHSFFSGDSQTPMIDHIEKAISLGLKHFCFTDHHDLYYPEAEQEDGSFRNIFLLDIPNYIKKLSELKTRYQSKINVLTGIELGLCNRALPEYKELLKQYSFDFILGSIHMVEGMDPYYPDFWLHHESREGIKKYFLKMGSMLEKFDNFDSLSHLDYIFRYVVDDAGNPDERNYAYADYADLIEPILKKVIEMGKALEVNTGGYRHSLNAPNPQPEVLKRYRELGGEKITIGSDCHRIQDMAHSFDIVEDLLKNLGFQYYEVYEHRKPTKIFF